MVRALLSGTKTQTRRVVKRPLLRTLSFIVDCGDGWWGDEEGEVQARCPHGQAGDRLWVKEAIRLVTDQEPDDGTGRVLSIYAADNTLTVASAWPWRRKQLSSIHCPRGLSRITLEVTGVRVERLQDISEADAIAEGIEPAAAGHWRLYGPDTNVDMDRSPRVAYRSLWESINGPGSWDANPWVWVIEVKCLNGGAA